MKIRLSLLLNEVRFVLLILFIMSYPFGYALNNIILALLIGTLLSDLDTKLLEKNGYLITAIASPFILLFVWSFIQQEISSSLFSLNKLYPLAVIPIAFLGSPNFQKIVNKNGKIILISVLSLATLICLISWINVIFQILIRDQPFSYIFRYRYSNIRLVRYLHTSSNYFSVFLNIAIFSALLLWSKYKLNQILTLLFMFLFLAFQLHLFSRNSLIISLSILIIFLIYNRQWKLIALFLFSMSIFIAYLLSYKSILTIRIKSFNFTDVQQVDKRILRWDSIIDIINESPIYGYSINQIDSVLQESYKKNELSKAFDNHYNAHNQYLSIALRHGYLGLLFFMCSMFYLIIWAYNNHRPTLFIVSMFLLNFLTESFLLRNKGVLLFSLIVSLSILLKNDEKD